MAAVDGRLNEKKKNFFLKVKMTFRNKLIFIFPKNDCQLHQIYLYFNINTTEFHDLFRYLVTNFHMVWPAVGLWDFVFVGRWVRSGSASAL
jgi:hypothetical protein